MVFGNSIMDHESQRMLRHDILGRLNGLKLCTTALAVCPTADERLEFIDDILKVTDKLDALMETLNENMEHASAQVH